VVLEAPISAEVSSIDPVIVGKIHDEEDA